MGPSSDTKLALGVFAATGAVVLSVILLKKLGQQSKTKSPSLKHKEKKSEPKEVPPTPAVVKGKVIQSEVKQPQRSTPALEISGDQPALSKQDSSGTQSPSTPPLQSLDGDSQTSYIFISGQDESKKTGERSSDESSYDVIDEEEKLRMADDVEEAVEEAKDESLKDTQSETSMVFVPDPEKHFGEISGSSIYASADETLEHSPVKGVEELEAVDENKEVDKTCNNPQEEEDNSGDKTVIKLGEQKSDSSGQGEVSSGDGGKLDESTGDSSFVSMGTTDSDSPTKESDSTKGGREPHSESVGTKVIPVSQAVLSPVEKEESSESASSSSQELPVKLKPDEIAEVVSSCSKSPCDVTLEQLTVLRDVLSQSDLPVVQTLALNSLVMVTAFSQNNDKLRTAGIPEAVKAIALTMKGEGQSDEEVKVTISVCQAVTNLTLDPQHCKDLEPVVPVLVDLLTTPQVPEPVLGAVFQPLINFSADPTFHLHLTRAVQTLLDMMDNGPSDLRVQCLRILVNLSLNTELVPNILAAKSPECLQSLLEPSTRCDLILRTLTFLLNLQSAVVEGHMTSDSLPTEDKAESPSTVHSALTGVQNLPSMKSKVFALTQYGEEDIRNVAGRLHKALGEPKSE